MRIGEQLRKYILSFPDEAADGRPVLEEAKLAEIGKWFAGAAALLVGLFGYLGMQGGTLDRVLRLYPSESLLTFCLVGAALLGAMLGSAIRDGYRLRLHAFVLGILALLLLVAWSLPDLHSASVLSLPLYYTYGAYASLFLLAVLTWRSRISLRAATLVTSVVLLTAGGYAGSKLSVLSKLAERRVPSVTVAVRPHEKNYMVQLRVRASELSDSQWVALEVSYDDTVSSLRLDPTALGELDSQAEVPVPETADQVLVSSQLCDITCDNQPIIENAALVLPPPAPSGTAESSIDAAMEASPALDQHRHTNVHTPSKRRGD